MVGSKITIMVNGKKTVEWDDPKALFKKGSFALAILKPQSEITFRKIEVKEIKK